MDRDDIALLQLASLVDQRAYKAVRAWLRRHGATGLSTGQTLHRAVENLDWAMVVLLAVHGASPPQGGSFQEMRPANIPKESSDERQTIMQSTLWLMDLCLKNQIEELSPSLLRHHMMVLGQAESELALVLRALEERNDPPRAFRTPIVPQKTAVMCVHRLLSKVGCGNFSTATIIKRIIADVYCAEVWSKFVEFEARAAPLD